MSRALIGVLALVRACSADDRRIAADDSSSAGLGRSRCTKVTMAVIVVFSRETYRMVTSESEKTASGAMHCVLPAL